MHPLAGYYINLDRSTDRDAFMREQLARLGMPWVQRHAAVDASHVSVPAGSPLLPGEYACFLSHVRVLEQAPPDAFTLVIEDDTELSEQLPEILARAVEAALPEFDIAMLECQPNFSLAHVSALWDTASRHFIGLSRRIGGVDLMDARLYFKWGTPAYLVPPRGRARLLELLRQGLAEGPMMPVDNCIKRGFDTNQLRGAITVPFLATTGLQWHGSSTIGNGMRMPADPLMVLRRLLYAGHFGAIANLTRSFATTPVDPALYLFTLVLRELAAHQRIEAQPQGRPGGPAASAGP